MIAGQMDVRRALETVSYNPELLALYGIDASLVEQKRAAAEKLAKVTDDSLAVEFEPMTATEGDEASRGHLFAVYVEGLLDDGALWLDDREGDLGQQLAARLRKMAAECERLAAILESGV
jgi:hypothetical protein